MPKISACIVAYCDYDEVCAAVRSILHYTPAPDLALYVVDNGSPDGCGRQLAAFNLTMYMMLWSKATNYEQANVGSDLLVSYIFHQN